MMNAQECVEFWQKKLRAENSVSREQERAKSLVATQLDGLKALKKSMHQRPQLATSFYINASSARSTKIGFSVRVSGAHIGTVALNDDVPTFMDGELKGQAWNSLQTLKLIRSFEKTRKLDEKNVEAKLLEILESGGKAKGPLGNHVAVKFPSGGAGLRIQLPNPAGPRGKGSTGHVDILARRGKGPKSRLRVLELKKPDATDGLRKTLEQAIAYCVGIAESSSPPIWKLYGYSKGTPPASLEATAVMEKSSKGCDNETCRKVLSQLGSAKIDSLKLSVSILLYTFVKGKLVLEEVQTATS